MFVAAIFMSIMDSTVVNTALPSIGRDLDTSAVWIEWVVLGYLLSLAIWIPASGWVGDRWGTKRTFLLALAVFTAGSVLCGLARGAGELVAFRIVQGIGGGMLTPVGTAMLFRAFPPERRARAAGILIVPTAIAPAVGPVLGGFLVEQLSWRWIFFVNAPLGLATLAFGASFLREHREPGAGGFDGLGFALSALGLTGTMFALTRAPSAGWTSPEVLVPGCVGLIATALLVRVELRRRDPLLKLRLLGDRLFGLTNVASFFGFGSYMGLLFAMPLFLQVARGASPLASGLTTFPEAIGVIVSSRLVARLYGTVGPRRLIAAGLAGTALAMAFCATIDQATDLTIVRIVMFGAGAGMAFVFVPLNAATFAGVSSADTGRASSIFNVQRRVAAATGIAVLATVLTTLDPALAELAPGALDPARLPSFRIAFLVDAAMALIGAFVALAIRDRDAAATMRPAAPAVGAGLEA